MKRGIIADYIRRSVPRPVTLPLSSSWLRNDGLRFYNRKRCPMGLLKEAASGEPSACDQFNPVPSGFTDQRISAFADWWDALDNPELAVKQLWGSR